MTEPANPESPTEPPGEGGVETVVVTIQDLAPLQELARSRAAFLSMVSHGLRAPLAAVKGSTARAPAERARTTFLGGGGRHAIAGDLPPNLPREVAEARRAGQVLANLFAIYPRRTAVIEAGRTVPARPCPDPTP